MDDQIAMRVGHGIAHLREELQALLERGLDERAVLRDRLPGHELHHHEGSSIARDAPVVEARDAWMFQRREDLALGLEALQLRGGLRLQQLDGDALVEVSPGTHRLVDLTHAAASDQAGQAPAIQLHPEGSVREDRSGGGGGRRAQEIPGGERGTQQAFDLRPDVGILPGAGAQRRETLRFGQIEQLIEQLIDAPLLGRR